MVYNMKPFGFNNYNVFFIDTKYNVTIQFTGVEGLVVIFIIT